MLNPNSTRTPSVGEINNSAREAHSFFVYNFMNGIAGESPVEIMGTVADTLAELTSPKKKKGASIVKKAVITNAYLGDPELEETGIILHTRKEEVIDDPVAWQICGDIVHVTLINYDYVFINDFAAIPGEITTEVFTPVAIIPNFDFGALADADNQEKILIVPDTAVPAIMDVGISIALYKIFTGCDFKQILATVLAGAHFVGIQYLLDIAPSSIRQLIDNAYGKLIELRRRSHIVNLIYSKLAGLINVNLSPEEIATFGTSSEAQTLVNMRELVGKWSSFAMTHPPRDDSMRVRLRKITHKLCGAISQRTVIERVLTPAGNLELTRKTTKPVVTSSIMKWRRRFRMNAAAINGKPLVANIGSEGGLGEGGVGGGFGGNRSGVTVRVPCANWEEVAAISALGNTLTVKAMSGYKVGGDYQRLVTRIRDAIENPLPSVVKRDIVLDCTASKYVETVVVQGLTRES